MIKKCLYCLLLSCLLIACGGKAPGTEVAMDAAEQIKTKTMRLNSFDWQGHRGCRGLLPENSVAGFLHALSFEAVQTLELDVVISADGQVIVSHEPWMNPQICLNADGHSLAADSKISILSLPAAALADYDCGSLGHPRFPAQRPMPVYKPTLAAVFEAVTAFCVTEKRPLPHFNIELKYLPEWEAAGLVPSIASFCDAVLREVAAFGAPDLINLQCFHPPVLAHLHTLAPSLSLAYLDEFPQQGLLAEKLDALGFTPPIYSPYHQPLTAAMVEVAQQAGMRVIPWTVNEVADLQRIQALGVAGIITDYPDRIAQLE